MLSQYSESDKVKAIQTLQSIEETLAQLMDWNSGISSTDDYYGSQTGMQLLAANCTLITAIGEGINRVNKILPDFLQSNFQTIPWRAIIGMRNHIAHGYFELAADLILTAVKDDIPPLSATIKDAIKLLSNNPG